MNSAITNLEKRAKMFVLDLDAFTPPVDGTILPGVTRDSVIALMRAHGSKTVLPEIPTTQKIHVHEEPVTISQVAQWAAEGRLLESFTVGTAVVVASVGRIGVEGKDDIELPKHESCLGPIAHALYERITAIQEGKEQYEGWSVVCE